MQTDQDHMKMKHISLFTPHYLFLVTLTFFHIPGILEYDIIYIITIAITKLKTMTKLKTESSKMFLIGLVTCQPEILNKKT